MQNKTFVHQLHSILSDSSVDGLIYWNEDLSNVFVLRPYHPEFGENVLRRYFKHGNVSSFVRQLHMYGFHKVGNNSVNRQSNYDEGIPVVSKKEPHFILWKFSHPSGLFHKDADFDTLCKITRKSIGLGKDGKRKNILSPVAVNYISNNIKIDPGAANLTRLLPETQLSGFNSGIYSLNPELITAVDPAVYELPENQEECASNTDNNFTKQISKNPGITSLIDSNLFILKKTTLIIIDILGQLNDQETNLKTDDICENMQKLEELKLQLINTQTALINITNSSTNINVTGNILQQNQYPTPNQYPSVPNYFPQM
ncbi:hypothetical protein RNJ44_01139 [Nakaseomyces bracarensis]|uniref:HSF-type DNA-binding domain-containing protein n=1 Tax=Nakaseomyces bracarensis TaxID=273131 RepID=A0ABR4NRC3_9SACH